MATYTEAKPSAIAVLKYLDYLEEYWLPQDLWRSWSLAGRLRAAAVLGVPVEGILPTTNHLESFNRVLKRGYIRQSERGGRRLRFDVFFHYLISSIIPAIFEAKRHETQHRGWVHSRFGGHDFLSAHQHRPRNDGPRLPIAWIPPAPSPSTRQSEGIDITRHNRLSNVRYIDEIGSVEATCLSSKWAVFDSEPITYIVKICADGFGQCSCPDFQHHSPDIGACKHLFALLEYLSKSRTMHPQYQILSYSLPTNPQDAIRIRTAHPPTDQDVGSSPVLTDPAIQLADLLEIPMTGLTEVSDSQGSESGMDSESFACTEHDLVEEPVVTEAVSDLVCFRCHISRSWKLEKTAGVQLSIDSSDHRALQEQLRVQLNHAVRRVLPQLYHIELILGDVKAVRTDDIAELQALLARLDSALTVEEATVQDGRKDEPLGHSNDRLVVDTVHAGRPHTSQLRPPSPEKRQERKQSYGVL